MTGMPDLIAKTRVFHAIDKLLNKSTVNELLAFQAALKQDLLGDLVISLFANGELAFKPEDRDHLLYDVFGREKVKGAGRKPWWDDQVEQVATEGYAHLVQHLCYDDPYPKNGELTKRKEAKKVGTLWLCPVTYYFRTMITKNEDNPGWVNFLVMTPPKKDHPEHYEEYKKRKPKKEKHEETPDVYDKPEDIWITSLERDNVKEGKKKNGDPIPLSIEIPAITKFAPPADTIQPLAEYY